MKYKKSQMFLMAMISGMLLLTGCSSQADTESKNQEIEQVEQKSKETLEEEETVATEAGAEKEQEPEKKEDQTEESNQVEKKLDQKKEEESKKSKENKEEEKKSETKQENKSAATETKKTAENVKANESQKKTEVAPIVEEKPQEQKEPQKPAGKYKDGNFSGSAAGYNGNISVNVKIQGDKITAVTIAKHTEDEIYMMEAEAVIGKIIQAQSSSVDSISGATYSSEGIKKAVQSALEKAKN